MVVLKFFLTFAPSLITPAFMCLQSKIIYNPFCESLKLSEYTIEYNGNIYVLPQLRNINWYTHAHSISGFTQDQKQIYDLVHNTQLFLNGCKIPVYVECKCGKCSECLKEKQSHFVSRCMLELLSNPYPVFVTLTYPDGELHDASYNEVSKFNKRLRENLKNYGFEHQFRSVFVDEYSPKGRFHHHGILFFDRPFFECIDKLFTLIKECWVGIPQLSDNFVMYRGEKCNVDKYGKPIFRFGLPYATNSRKTERSRYAVCVESARNPVALTRYVAKYITKSSVTCVHTPRKIALGCTALPLLKSLYENSNTNKVTFRVGNHVVNCSVPPQVLCKLYPSLSQQYDLTNLRTLYYLVKNSLRQLSPCESSHCHVLHYFPPRRCSSVFSNNLGSILQKLSFCQKILNLSIHDKKNLLNDITNAVISEFEPIYNYQNEKYLVLSTIKDIPLLSYEDYHESLFTQQYNSQLESLKKVNDNDLFL